MIETDTRETSKFRLKRDIQVAQRSNYHYPGTGVDYRGVMHANLGLLLRLFLTATVTIIVLTRRLSDAAREQSFDEVVAEQMWQNCSK